MSGGSYNYLCHAEVDELLSGTHHIQDMADRLAGLGYADDAAKETEELLSTLRQFQNKIDAMKDKLTGVWREVEWWDSSDGSEESVIKALKEYRGEK